MRKGLAVSELGDLLEQPLVGVLATFRRDGSLLLSPVWQRWRDGGFEVVSRHDDVKVGHLRRDPRASILVFEQTPPYRGIELRGEAELLTEGAHEAARDLAVRHLGREAGEAYVADGLDDTLIRLEPGRLRIWDFADEA